MAAVLLLGRPGGGGGIGTEESAAAIGSGKRCGAWARRYGRNGGRRFPRGRKWSRLTAVYYCPQPEYSDEARKAKYQGHGFAGRHRV